MQYLLKYRFLSIFPLPTLLPHYSHITQARYGRPRPLPRKELALAVTLTLCFTHCTLLGSTRSQSVPSSPPVCSLHTLHVYPLSLFSQWIRDRWGRSVEPEGSSAANAHPAVDNLYLDLNGLIHPAVAKGSVDGCVRSSLRSVMSANVAQRLW